MAIVHLGAKRLQGLKIDRVNDSLGSSADGTNSGITLVTSGEALNTAVVNFGNITAQGNWEKTGSGGALTFTNGINQESGGSGNTQMPYLDLQNSSYLGSGNYASETKWTLRWKQTWASSPDNYGTPFMVLSSTTGYQSASQNYIGIRFDGSSITAGGETSSSVDGASSSTGVSTSYTSTTYYMELVRDGSNIYVRNYTSSAYDTIAQESSAISIGSGTYNLRYIKMIPRWDTGNGDYDTTWDHIKFYNGVAFQLKQNKLGTGAYSLNGTSSHVTVGSTSDWNFVHDGSGATVSAWVYRNGSQTGNGGIFVTEGGQSTTTGFGLGIRSGGNAYARTINTSNSWQVCEDTSSSVSTGVWHHILATIDSTSIKLYVDGTLNSSHTISGTLKSGNSSYRAVGRAYSGSAWSYLNGNLDDMGIWKRVLTATEISDLVNISTNSLWSPNASITSGTSTGASDDNIVTMGAISAWGNKIRGKDITNSSEQVIEFSVSNTNINSFIGIANGTDAITNGFYLTSGGDIFWKDGSGEADTNSNRASGDTYKLVWATNGNVDLYLKPSGGSYGSSLKSWTSVSGTKQAYIESYASAVITFIPSAPINGALVSSLSDKSGLKAHYTMDSTSKPLPTATLSEDFSSSSAWTLHSSSSISGGSLTCNNTGESYRSTGLGKPTNLTWDFTWTRNSGDDADTSALLLSSQTSGYGDPSTGHTNVQFYMANGNVTTLSVRKNSSGTNVQTECHFGVGSSSVNIQPTGTTRYYRITKDGSVWTMKKFTSASDRTNDTNAEASTTATQSSTADSTWNSGSGNLTYLVVDGHGSQTKNYTIDDVAVYEGVTTGSKNDFSSTSDLVAMTNLPVNTIFEQTDDTPSYWWKQSDNTWKLDGSVGTDISSGGWSTSGSQNAISEASGVITFNVPSSNTGDTLFIKSLPATAGSSWVVRYKLDITQSNYSGSGSGNHIVGISDSFSRSGSGEDPPSSSKSMYLKNTYHSDKKFAQYWTNGSTSGNDWSNGVTLSGGAQTWYVTIANNGGSITTRYGANSDYTGGSITPAWTVDSTTQSASKTKIFISTYASSSMSGGAFIGTISDLTFYNNKSSVPS